MIQVQIQQQFYRVSKLKGKFDTIKSINEKRIDLLHCPVRDYTSPLVVLCPVLRLNFQWNTMHYVDVVEIAVSINCPDPQNV